MTQSPSIGIDKEGSVGGGGDSVGDVITYTFDVTNDGNVTLTNVLVTISCVPSQGSTLAPQATMGCSATYAIDQADLDAGQVDNTATATGTPPSGPGVDDMDPNTETLTQNPEIHIVKTTDTPIVVPGSAVAFTIAVSNIGNVTLTGVSVSDVLASDCDEDLGTLDPGEGQLLTRVWWLA